METSAKNHKGIIITIVVTVLLAVIFYLASLVKYG